MPKRRGLDTPNHIDPPTLSGTRDVVALLLVAAPLVAAWLLETKWVIAVGFAASIFLLSDAIGRLYDLCLRVQKAGRPEGRFDSRG